MPGSADTALLPWERDCLRALGPRLAVAGVGNRDRGDDGVGSVVAEMLAARGVSGVVDCGVVPENFLLAIAGLEPDHVLFVDAADLGASPGSISLVREAELGGLSPSTHAAGLGPLVEFLRREAGASCHLLAIQPSGDHHTGELSAAGRRAAEQVARSAVWDLIAAGGRRG